MKIFEIPLVSFVMLLSVLSVFSSAAKADLGIDRYVFLKEPVQLMLKYDFDDANIVYYIPGEFVLCQQSNGKPHFFYHSFQTDQNQRITIIDLKLCNQISNQGSKDLLQAKTELNTTNPRAVFQKPPAGHVAMPSDFIVWPFEGEIRSFCTDISISPTEPTISCQVQKIGDEPLMLKDHLENFGFSNLVSVFYPGSMQDSTGARIRTSQSSKLVWRIDPLSNYPELFVSE